jgi:hypothetical protein
VEKARRTVIFSNDTLVLVGVEFEKMKIQDRKGSIAMVGATKE